MISLDIETLRTFQTYMRRMPNHKQSQTVTNSDNVEQVGGNKITINVLSFLLIVFGGLAAIWFWMQNKGDISSPIDIEQPVPELPAE